MGGFVGQVSYYGDIDEFLTILRLGEIVHVGKACTFGMGKYQIY
jgi:CRISPR/Cas system endoribonuclease Cas6 (RAMP superfamily)